MRSTSAVDQDAREQISQPLQDLRVAFVQQLLRLSPFCSPASVSSQVFTVAASFLSPVFTTVSTLTRTPAVATQVASLDALLGVKVSAVGEVDASAAARLEKVVLEQHPRLERYRKALSWMLRFARDVHLDCTAETLADWLAPAPGDR